ncbi:uncharacterized protein MELLADRAFT_72302 [Melampsora larici-populina 98AG31]|uniref:Uncharacterized protein n=1 Tax=Melampsora larici-populina (strain 98AG31 / pathotype 3-4-7) TaxID=747676 RepID=F4RS92_MELLP|nr:uncharacterized protein MELLADRAFT_72302 [Melampsora larici-populina 98AG31]EGG04817.1 hypothetical protein MELLADRAFT_72302 [Melampsora larici-populina 98AG31]
MQVYSTNKSFSEWADKQMKLSTKFQYYVHGKTVANEIEKKPPQPVDARRGELTRELNKLIGELFSLLVQTITSLIMLFDLFVLQAKHLPGKVFPKKDHPVQILADRGWPVRIVAQPNCSLLPEELDLGFRDCDDLQKKKWLSDIANGLFDVEKIPASELVSQKKQKKRKRSNKKLDSDLNDQDTTTARTSTSTSVTNHENRPNSQNSLSGSTILTTQKTQTESSQQAPRENDKHSDNSDDTVSSDDEES